MAPRVQPKTKLDQERSKTGARNDLGNLNDWDVKQDSEEREDLRELEEHLLFDQDALNEALIEQPDLFYRVGKAYALAISVRDGIKMDLERATAELDKQLRQKALDTETKITETSLAKEIMSAPKIISLNDKLAAAQLRVGKWGVLKEAYIQRSYAIKDMVALYQANYFNNHVGQGARNDAITHQADNNRRDAGQARRLRD